MVSLLGEPYPEEARVKEYLLRRVWRRSTSSPSSPLRRTRVKSGVEDAGVVREVRKVSVEVEDGDGTVEEDVVVTSLGVTTRDEDGIEAMVIGDAPTSVKREKLEVRQLTVRETVSVVQEGRICQVLLW